jgi:endo-1,4-beta-xylanase
MRSTTIQSSAVAAALLLFACSSVSTNPPDEGQPSTGGLRNTGGSLTHQGGVSTSAGGTGNVSSTGGHGGAFSSSGGTTVGGTTVGGSSSGGSPFGGSQGGSFGGFPTGSGGAGGKTNVGTGGTGGKPSSGAAGASSGNGSGPSSGSAGAGALDCNATMPSNGTKHTGDGQGGNNNLAWQLWANSANNGSITIFSTPAFSTSWNNAGDFLARLGYEWGNAGKSYDSYGAITAQFAYKKTGNAGGYSYIGIYGWSTNPCVEWYIVDDSFNGMPVNPGNTSNKGTVTIDGGDYILYTRQTNGTGGSRCNGVSSWAQYYSVRKTARQCGTISITQHFDAWKTAGMPLGNLLEAKILVEVGGGSGSVDFPVANVTLSK